MKNTTETALLAAALDAIERGKKATEAYRAAEKAMKEANDAAFKAIFAAGAFCCDLTPYFESDGAARATMLAAAVAGHKAYLKERDEWNKKEEARKAKRREADRRRRAAKAATK